MSKVSAVVTGLGPISAIGCGREDFWQALISGQHGFGPITLCDVSFSPSRIGAEVKDFRLESFIEGGRAIARRAPRASQFALAASALAFEDSNIDLENCDRNRFGIIVGTSVGNIGEMFACRDKWLAGGKASPSSAFQMFHHSAACLLSSYFDLRGPIQTISSGCNSGLDAIGQALRLIQTGLVDAVLVVGTDCELVPEIIAALNASNSLSTRYNDSPGEASRPFDLERDGNVVGEGAAALLLEAESHAIARGAKCYARVGGYSVSAAGRHRRYNYKNPDLDLKPCVRALRAVIKEAGWQPEEVDLVNANGSSSVLYDKLEASAYSVVFGKMFPEIRVHSIKSMLGQHGAGSSALQVVTACLALEKGFVPPTINHENPDPACGPIRIVTEKECYRPQKVIVNSIGFGGFYYSCGAFTNMN